MFFEIFSIFLQILQHHHTIPAQKPHIDVLFGHLEQAKKGAPQNGVRQKLGEFTFSS
ncbi:MAG: hypothetical protein HDT43_04330 [Ruminococcaceae bacterium]|nr:hypothetical protein [Oscillospiraceae bacterium]